MKMLVDGNNLIYRFNSVLNLTDRQGKSISGLYGAIGAIHRWRKSGRKNIFFVWDRGHSPERKEIYPGYKKRDKFKTPEDEKKYLEFRDQCKELYDILPAFGVTMVSKKGTECDDIIAKIASSSKGMVAIVSEDSDYLQLVSDNVIILKTSNGFSKPVTRKDVVASKGFEPEDLVYLKAMVGDVSDAIKGIQGIGEKRAALLLKEYPSIRNFEVPKPKTSKGLDKYLGVLKEHRKEFVRNYMLIKLPTPLFDLDLSTVEVIKPELDKTRMRRFLEKHQFVSFLTNFSSFWETISEGNSNEQDR